MGRRLVLGDAPVCELAVRCECCALLWRGPTSGGPTASAVRGLLLGGRGVASVGAGLNQLHHLRLGPVLPSGSLLRGLPLHCGVLRQASFRAWHAGLVMAVWPLL